MKRLLALLMCMLLPASALAQDGVFYEGLKQEALSEGLTMETEVTFEWGKLPGVTEEENLALGSVMDALAFRVLNHQTESGAWFTLDVLLQETSILDFTLEHKDGLYYEQSSFLAGQTVAFSPKDYARLSETAAQRSGIDPQAFSGMMIAMFEEDGTICSGETLKSLAHRTEAWNALPMEEVPTPELMLPGISGQRAESVTLQKADFISLFQQVKADFASEQQETQETGEEAAEGQTLLKQAADLLSSIPTLLEQKLPEAASAEYTKVYDAAGGLVCSRLLMDIQGEPLLAEWTDGTENIRALYVEGKICQREASLLLTFQESEEKQNANKTSGQEQMAMYLSFQEEGTQLPVILDATFQSESEGDGRKENTAWTLRINLTDTNGAQQGLEIEGTEEIRGSGENLKRTQKSQWFATGLSEKRQLVFNMSIVTRAEEIDSPIDMQGEIVSPGNMSDEELSAWMDEVEGYLPQAALSMLALLPSDAAAYLVSAME